MKKALFTLFTIALVISYTCHPVLEIGHCIDGDGNGHIDKSTDRIYEPYTYISYEGIAAEGERVFTFSLVNPIDPEPDNTILVIDYNTNTHAITKR